MFFTTVRLPTCASTWHGGLMHASRHRTGSPRRTKSWRHARMMGQCACSTSTRWWRRRSWTSMARMSSVLPGTRPRSDPVAGVSCRSRVSAVVVWAAVRHRSCPRPQPHGALMLIAGVDGVRIVRCATTRYLVGSQVRARAVHPVCRA